MTHRCMCPKRPRAATCPECGGETTLRAELRRLGCSDGYCIIAGKATGMHTNGGCHCLMRGDPMERARVAQALRLLREAAGVE